MSSLHDLYHAIGGTVRVPSGIRDARVVRLGHVATDSRQVEPGDVFWALSGTHRDGVEFAGEAFARGAAGAVVHRPVEAPADRWIVQVPDTLEALWRWAGWKRRRFPGHVIAVTGSVGKTTTRQMIHAVLASRLKGTVSPRNYNNHVGLPLSMLQIEPDQDYAVLELGASGPGEIARLAGLCSPTIGVITQAGDAHLGGFGGRL